jgi:hypothetical protein
MPPESRRHRTKRTDSGSRPHIRRTAVTRQVQNVPGLAAGQAAATDRRDHNLLGVIDDVTPGRIGAFCWSSGPPSSARRRPADAGEARRCLPDHSGGTCGSDHGEGVGVPAPLVTGQDGAVMLPRVVAFAATGRGSVEWSCPVEAPAFTARTRNLGRWGRCWPGGVVVLVVGHRGRGCLRRMQHTRAWRGVAASRLGGSEPPVPGLANGLLCLKRYIGAVDTDAGVLLARVRQEASLTQAELARRAGRRRRWWRGMRRVQ